MSQIDSVISFRISTPEYLSKVKKLLTDQNLPLEGVEDQFNNYILAFIDDSNFIGCAGLEIYDHYGLVRSVAIQTEFQNKKLGSKLIQQLEQYAKKKHITELYLLTETAQNFFSKHGYTVVDRVLVPKEIQESYEYTTACKISALVMKKELG